MREASFCGRIGEVEDRELVRTTLGEPALGCPDEACGHTDRLEWLPEETRRLVVKEAARRGANAPIPGESVQIMRRKGGSRTSHSRSTVQRERSVARLAVAPLVIVGFLLGSSSGAAAASSENASCVEKFNVAVGTPDEFQRVFHQDKLGRDVSFFARLGEECPLG